MGRINELQEGVAKKIQPKKKKVAPVCTGYLKALTKTKFSGLMYYVEGRGLGGEIEVLLEDPIDEKAKVAWEDDNFGTTSVITKSPLSLTLWRKSKPEWQAAKKAIDVFFKGSKEDYRKLFTDEQWSMRKKACAGLCGVAEGLVTDAMLEAKFEESKKAANTRLSTQVTNWKKNPRHKDVPDKDVEEHLNQIVADILFMTGREKAQREEDKWQMLYEHTLKDQQDHVDACAPLLGYEGNNFEHIMIAYSKDIKEVHDGIFEKRDRSPSKDRSTTSAPMDIPQKKTPPSPKKKQHSPEDVRMAALDMLLNSATGAELARIAVADPAGANKSLNTMTNFIEQRLSAPTAAPLLESSEVSSVSNSVRRSPSSSVSSSAPERARSKHEKHKKSVTARKLSYDEAPTDADSSSEEMKTNNLKPMSFNMPPLSPGSSPRSSLKSAPLGSTMFRHTASPPASSLSASDELSGSSQSLVLLKAGGSTKK